MNIGYFSVLGRAWARAKGILFNPVDLNKWMGLGFTAWLATLGESSSGGGRAMTNWRDDNGRREDFSDWTLSASDAVRDFFSSGLEVALVSALFMLAILIALLVTWLSSRGHFMFLDNVVQNRSCVREPWNRLGYLGDSLFVWRLVFGAVALVFVGGGVLFGLLSIVPLAAASDGGAPAILAAIGLGLFLLGAGLLAAFIEMLLYHFVVPLMYKYNTGVMDAWRRFMALFQRETVHFVLYAIFLFVVYLLFGLAVVVIGFATCCVGFVVMLLFAIPVIGAVLALPVHVTWRCMGLEFLAQFGKEFDVLPEEPEVETSEGGEEDSGAGDETEPPQLT